MDIFRNMDEKQKKWLITAILVLAALVSFFVIAGLLTTPMFTNSFVAYLDEKKKTVLELTAAATASSAAITMIPGDIGTPIADKLADLSGYMVIVLCAIFLEKYLVTITGHAAFRILIPLALLAFIPGIWNEKHKSWYHTAKRVIGFSLILYLLIPASIGISKTIENTYDTSIQETIDNAKESADEIQNNSETQSIWNKFISTIEGGLNTVTDRFEGILNGFIEATAVLIVTACIIPIVVLFIMYWIVKMLLGVNRPMPDPRTLISKYPLKP